MLRKIFKHLFYSTQNIVYLLFPIIKETRNTNAPIKLIDYLIFILFKNSSRAYWPVHKTSTISYPERIEIGIGAAPGLSPNCYIQGMGGVKIGNYTLVAPGVGIISANHSIKNINTHIEAKVIIGSYSWIGMNAVILPGVVLGDHTIVAAGTIVTKSFTEGYCVLAGVPAKIIKHIERSEIFEYKNEYEYVGFYKKDDFIKSRNFILNKNYSQ